MTMQPSTQYILDENQMKDIKSLITLAEEYIKETGGCDHSVNICVCADRTTVMNAYDILHKASYENHAPLVKEYDPMVPLGYYYYCGTCGRSINGDS